MSYKDVREWIHHVDEMGELKIIHGADWNLEIGALSVLASKHKQNSPALLLDRIKDYPAGYRILVGFFESLKRSALTTNCRSISRVKASFGHGAIGWRRPRIFHP
jgi:4-hydroxy-3-polyprenylbenzoate decarboxylase